MADKKFSGFANDATPADADIVLFENAAATNSFNTTFQQLSDSSALNSGARSIFVFRPGGTAAANIYISWAALMTDLALVDGAKIVVLDNSVTSPVVIPAGTYDMDEAVIEGRLIVGQTGFTPVTLSDGVIFDNLTGFTKNLTITANNTTTPVITITATAGLGPQFNANSCQLTNAGTEVFIEMDMSTLFSVATVFLENGTTFDNSGGTEILNISTSAFAFPVLILIGSTIESDTLRNQGGGSPTLLVNIFVATTIFNDTQTNLTGAPSKTLSDTADNITFDTTGTSYTNNIVEDALRQIDGNSTISVKNIVQKVFADSPYTILATDYTIATNATGGATSIRLVGAEDTGTIYVIKKIDASVNAVTVDVVTGADIDGSLTYVLSLENESVTVQFDGINYIVI